MENSSNNCHCPHHKVSSVLLILFGLTFLLGYWGTLSWSTVNIIWPILVILAGVMHLVDRSRVCKCC